MDPNSFRNTHFITSVKLQYSFASRTERPPNGILLSLGRLSAHFVRQFDRQVNEAVGSWIPAFWKITMSQGRILQMGDGHVAFSRGIGRTLAFRSLV